MPPHDAFAADVTLPFSLRHFRWLLAYSLLRFTISAIFAGCHLRLSRAVAAHAAAAADGYAAARR